MKKIIYNEESLKEEDINEVVVRAKALIINDGKILLGNERDILQFPGGHLEKQETLEDCLRREVLEETGIELENEEINGPFLQIVRLNKDWPKKGENRRLEIYYYLIKTTKEPDINKVNYTEHEKTGNFKVIEIPLDLAIDTINNNIINNELNTVIAPDMIVALEYYFNNNEVL